jgi:transcriptional regulator with XRE-family HTH domain
LVPFGDINSPNGDNQESERKFLQFAERLHLAAGEAGASQAKLASQLGLTRGTFTRYWNGDRLPPADTLIELADAVNVTPKWLIKGGPSRQNFVARAIEDSDWIDVPEYDLRQFDDASKGEVISSTVFRKDWLYLTLGETSGLWISKTLSGDPVRGLPAGAPIFCKDQPKGEAPAEGQFYLFRVNGGIVLARFTYRPGNFIGDRLGDQPVTPYDLETSDNQHFIVARVLGALARPLT